MRTVATLVLIAMLLIAWGADARGPMSCANAPNITCHIGAHPTCICATSSATSCHYVCNYADHP